MADLRADALELTVPGKPYDNHRARYLATIGPIRQMLLDDQVKLNDPGASEYLIETLGAGRLGRAAALLRGRGLAACATARATMSAPRRAMPPRSSIPMRPPTPGAGTAFRC